jgi:hypothetical protein
MPSTPAARQNTSRSLCRRLRSHAPGRIRRRRDREHRRRRRARSRPRGASVGSRRARDHRDQLPPAALRPRALSVLSPRQPARPSLLHAVRHPIGHGVSLLRRSDRGRREILRRLWRGADDPRADDPSIARPHADPLGEDPPSDNHGRGRAQAGHRPLRRRDGFDGAGGATRPRGVVADHAALLPHLLRRHRALRGLRR